MDGDKEGRRERRKEEGGAYLGVGEVQTIGDEVVGIKGFRAHELGGRVLHGVGLETSHLEGEGVRREMFCSKHAAAIFPSLPLSLPSSLPRFSTHLLKQKPYHPSAGKLRKVIDDCLWDKLELDVQLVDEVDLAVRGRNNLELKGGRVGGKEGRREGMSEEI